ncbi:MAG: hypothetical protein KDE28_30845 [Anaerolineales bacterium]|nr:hypothetical protein [Anaerolineales bacterium]
MTMIDDLVLLDAPFVPDPDADEELNATTVTAIADEDLRGSRLLLVRRAVEPFKGADWAGGVVQLACTFQPALGARFSSAQLRLRLTSPAGLLIQDLAPARLTDPHPVEVTLNSKGQLGIASPVVPLQSSLELRSSRKYSTYHCLVQGSGEGTALARWDFRENPDRRDGLGQEQLLTLTLPATGLISAEVMVTARLAWAGLQGVNEAIRDLLIGPTPFQRKYPISFEIPQQPSPEGLARFLKLI